LEEYIDGHGKKIRGMSPRDLAYVLEKNTWSRGLDYIYIIRIMYRSSRGVMSKKEWLMHPVYIYFNYIYRQKIQSRL
jgi:hypothetical protein